MDKPSSASLAGLLRRLRRAPVATIRTRLRRLIREIVDWPHDLRLGIHTGAILRQFTEGHLENGACEPAPYQTLAAIGRHMTTHGVVTARFVDLGSGMGRPLYVFAPRFEELIGYELVPPVQSMAANQLERVRSRQPAFERISMTCADATVAVPLDQPLVMFMYNPFGRKPMARLCERLREARCEVHLYYVNPVFEAMISG